MTQVAQAMVVEGTPLQQENRFAVGPYSSSEDEDDSPPLLSVPETSVATASMNTMAATFTPDAVVTALAEIKQMFSNVHENIGIVQAESASLVVINKITRTAVGDSMAKFLCALEITDQKNDLALAAYERRAMAMTEVHSKSIGDMQAKLQGSLDRMKYLEKKFQNVPGLITAHLEERLPAILTDVVGKALAPTLTTVLTECLPPTMTSVLEGSLADFQSQFGSAGGADSTLPVRELLEAATDSRISDHFAVMTAIEGIGACLSALDDVIASSDTSNPVDPPPPTVDPLIPGHGQTMPKSVSFTRQHHLNVAREPSWLS